jgi:hypothetical protein
MPYFVQQAYEFEPPALDVFVGLNQLQTLLNWKVPYERLNVELSPP